MYKDSFLLNKKTKIKQFINKKLALQCIISALICSMIPIPITNKIKVYSNDELVELGYATIEGFYKIEKTTNIARKSF